MPSAEGGERGRGRRSTIVQRISGPNDELAWLRSGPTLAELSDAYPREWERVQRELHAVLARDDADELIAYIRTVSQPETLRAGGRMRHARERIDAEARRQMAALALKRAVFRVSTGVPEGRVRFDLVNGFVAQKLLFKRDLERKPVSMWLFRLVWPLLGQRRLLMPLVQPEGIWCFYSAPLVARLAALIDGRSCLEIAAGDGTLSRFLGGAGVRITATDDYSWSDSIDFPSSVLRQDARSALREHKPEVVVCSWPPAGNLFERHVFTTASVQQYIVIASESEHSTGNWAAYRQQSSFDLVKDERLSRLVLPPEVKHAVYVFTRRASANSA